MTIDEIDMAVRKQILGEVMMDIYSLGGGVGSHS